MAPLLKTLHCFATTCDHIYYPGGHGRLAIPAGSDKGSALSCIPAAPSDEADSPLIPALSPYLVQRPNDFSESLAWADPEGKESGDRGL